MSNDYKYFHQTYPVFSEELSPEGSFKRFSSMPGPQEVFSMAMKGLPKVYPLTKEPITVDDVVPYLNSAVTEIEMKLNMNISEVTHFHHEDHVADMFGSNYSGVLLRSWPATEIISFQLKFPHAATTTPYITYTIPAPWLYLRRNKVNIVASAGAVYPHVDAQGFVAAGGIFGYIAGLGRGAYQPGSLEIIYKAGFKHDKLPSSLADLITTWAARRFLMDIFPVLFPTSGTSVSIDGVAQSVSYNVPQMIITRMELLEKKIEDLIGSLKSQFGKNINYAFIGA